MSDKNKQAPDLPPDRARLREEAAEWIARLQNTDFDPGEPFPDLEERNRAFLDWVRQSKHHLDAYLEVSGFHYGALPGIGSLPKINVAVLVAQAHVEAWVNEEAKAREQMRTRRYSRPFPWYRLAAALTVVAVAAYFAWLYLQPALPDGVFSTRVGEVKTVTFQDGTRVALDTDTRIVAHYTAAGRQVDVTRGNAIFTVVHDTARPFTSCVGGIRVTDLGTEYAAEVSATGARITVRSGRVEVIGPCSPDAISQRREVEHRVLEAGQHADIDLVASGLRTQVTPRTRRQMNLAFSWQRGVLIFDGIPLKQAIPEINRYLPRKLALGEPALADIPFGGTVKISVLEESILFNLKNTYSIIPDPARTSADEVVLIPAPGHPLGGPY
jgi:transmembrane sensor